MPKTLVKGKTGYTPVKIPNGLVEEMDQLLGKHGYCSRIEIAKDAIRRLLTQLREEEAAAK